MAALTGLSPEDQTQTLRDLDDDELVKLDVLNGALGLMAPTSQARRISDLVKTEILRRAAENAAPTHRRASLRDALLHGTNNPSV